MLLNLREYHRPAVGDDRRGLERALELLGRPGIRTVPLAGGGTLLASADATVEAVVDLQGLGLDLIVEEAHPGGRLRIGAMVTRTSLAGSEAAQAHHCGILAEAARRWGGSVQRNRATTGGALVTAAANDPLMVALLACDALVTLFGAQGTRLVPLGDFLPSRRELLAAPALITEVVVPPPHPWAAGALKTVARTPADAPIAVAAAALARTEDRCASARLALGGVADLPLRLLQVEAMLVDQVLTPDLIARAAARAGQAVQPRGDFRGSAAYRRALAEVLTERALRQAWQALA